MEAVGLLVGFGQNPGDITDMMWCLKAKTSVYTPGASGRPHPRPKI